MPDEHEAHPLTVLEEVPEWIHGTMVDLDYHLMPCSWANALYEWHDANVEGTPAHTVEMYFFSGGEQVRLLATDLGDTYESAFCTDDETDMLRGEIATLRQRLRQRHA